MREPSKDPKRRYEKFPYSWLYQVEKDIVWKVIEEDPHSLRPQIIGYLDALGISMQ